MFPVPSETVRPLVRQGSFDFGSFGGVPQQSEKVRRMKLLLTVGPTLL